MMSETHCYHCGLPIPEKTYLPVRINHETHLMCCAGCQAVAQAIVDSGLTDFYDYRTDNAPTGREIVPSFLQQTTVYDNPQIQKRFVREEGENIYEAALILEGITCAACVWLNERHLRSLSGVLEVSVNYTTHRARVRWDSRKIQLSDILQAVTRIGYLAHPYDPDRQQAVLEQERRYYLRRIGVAGVLSMQIMMFALAVYAAEWSGTQLEDEFRILFNWISLLLTIPIMLYAATPFFNNAYRDLSLRRVGMDVPVALGLLLAFVGSVWTTIVQGTEHVYYDSVSMFVFFLLSGRYFELVARQKSSHASESLVRIVPSMATRLITNATGTDEELVLVADLAIGDTVLIRPGENIPADGQVIAGYSSIDESLLTGESRPIEKHSGDTVIAGTINIESPLQMRVDKIGADTVLSHILRLLERAQTEKPNITQFADQIAGWFVGGVLLLSVIVAFYWWQVDPSRWLEITLSVLVVTCPCALSLATPTAITAATSTLTRIGLLTTRGHALETLARATHIVFDKTGTLTIGRLTLHSTHNISDWTTSTCLQYATALEKYSEHPIAKALHNACTNTPLSANAVINQLGAGLQGEINGKTYFVGTVAFIQTQTTLTLPLTTLNTLQKTGQTLVCFADKQQIHCIFLLDDELRAGARELIDALRKQHKQLYLFSGDHVTAVQNVALAVGITDYAAELSPADKLSKVKALQAQGAVVVMIGDGVNDAPVLAQAQVSIAMGSGTQIARASADMILLSEQLSNLNIGIQTAQKTLIVIRQNIVWAIAYNVLALPAAALGFVPPWLAALGMSLSSLLVVLNALRLVKKE
ncbi:heavy metal translocating P-type ATPase [Beggiatoa leptomitoformis]|uniref:Heavy metal translocating P-type ATPase n=1 Tax=Beggiatoa leptomitoformis TaxID=288004 RepID=A0A2N9YIG5_9GAMM|nr:heavy metal translocating P-type ATPase [Beggiatoa leptomitoformis]ALG67742.1 heavy metal translocating P-type ATPase [Beggiatoa leptomitoformis]AUI70016.1 heavy metal translocating P-type ATPase [Beggiatoa leptomitoformis]